MHSSVYLPEAVYEALREAAFKERCKIHDLIMEGVGMALRRRGYPAMDDLILPKDRASRSAILLLSAVLAASPAPSPVLAFLA